MGNDRSEAFKMIQGIAAGMGVNVKISEKNPSIPDHICGTCYHEKSTASTCSVPNCEFAENNNRGD